MEHSKHMLKLMIKKFTFKNCFSAPMSMLGIMWALSRENLPVSVSVEQ